MRGKHIIYVSLAKVSVYTGLLGSWTPTVLLHRPLSIITNNNNNNNNNNSNDKENNKMNYSSLKHQYCLFTCWNSK